ncbi:MAG: hypothetical protein HeimC2_00430 [Candidatus Heimdallarchaeota archaeon LC_2]|nr:MAG: hypothetical protein HeimC2_00430 [Candidatus Heimdallarchaeota archaeon LC_2]
MSPYPVKFHFSLDYLEQNYRKFIEENFLSYVEFWENFVGIHSIENGLLKGYKLSFEDSFTENAKLSNQFENIRIFSYSILVQLILIEEIDTSNFRTTNYLESIKFVQNLTNYIGTLFYYCGNIWQSLMKINKLFKGEIIKFEDFISDFGMDFVSFYKQFKDWRDTNVHQHVLIRALDDEKGIQVPKGDTRNLDVSDYEYIGFEDYFEKFYSILLNFMNFLFTKVNTILSGAIFSANADLDKPMAVSFQNGDTYETIVVESSPQDEKISKNVYLLEDIFRDGYENIPKKFIHLKYIHGSGSVNLEQIGSDPYYLY